MAKHSHWVLEVTSSITQQEDEQDKPEIYSLIGVKEYFQYDPTGDYLNPQLKGRRLMDSPYQVLTPDRTEDGMLVFLSVVLGLEMRLLRDGRLRFFDPAENIYELFKSRNERSCRKKNGPIAWRPNCSN